MIRQNVVPESQHASVIVQKHLIVKCLKETMQDRFIKCQICKVPDLYHNSLNCQQLVLYLKVENVCLSWNKNGLPAHVCLKQYMDPTSVSFLIYKF